MESQDIWKLILDASTLAGGILVLYQIRRWLIQPSVFEAQEDVELSLEKIWLVLKDTTKWQKWMFGRWCYGALNEPQDGTRFTIPFGNLQRPNYIEVTRYEAGKVIAVGDSEFALVGINPESVVAERAAVQQGSLCRTPCPTLDRNRSFATV